MLFNLFFPVDFSSLRNGSWSLSYFPCHNSVYIIQNCTLYIIYSVTVYQISTRFRSPPHVLTSLTCQWLWSTNKPEVTARNLQPKHLKLICRFLFDGSFCFFLCLSPSLVRLHDSIAEEGFHYLVFDLWVNHSTTQTHTLPVQAFLPLLINFCLLSRGNDSNFTKRTHFFSCVSPQIAVKWGKNGKKKTNWSLKSTFWWYCLQYACFPSLLGIFTQK